MAASHGAPHMYDIRPATPRARVIALDGMRAHQAVHRASRNVLDVRELHHARLAAARTAAAEEASSLRQVPVASSAPGPEEEREPYELRQDITPLREEELRFMERAGAAQGAAEEGAEETEDAAIREAIRGLEGHSFLLDRAAVEAEIQALEERERKLRLLRHLAADLGHDVQPTDEHTAEEPRRMRAPRRPLLRHAARSALGALRAVKLPSLPSLPSLPRVSLKAPALPALPTLRVPRISLPSLPAFSLSDSARRMVFAGSLALILVAGGLWAKTYADRTAADIRHGGLAAYAQMREGINAALRRDFSAAQGSFGNAHAQLKELGGASRVFGKSLAFIADAVSVSTETSAGVHLLEAAERFAKAGESLAAYAGLFAENGIASLTPREFITGYLTDADLQQAKRLLVEAVENLTEADARLRRVSVDDLPEDVRENVATLREKVPMALAAAKEFASFQDALFDALGYLGPRKYLIVFQNSAELRPTGGFVGSFALVDVLDGKVTKLTIDDVFNVDGQLVDKVVPPRPIQKISTAWSLHDANWFLDYPTSARKIAWFYEKTGGASVDGVIAMTPAVLERLMGLAGDVELPGYGLAVTSQNVRDELSFLVEEGLERVEGQSTKVVLRDLGMVLFDRMQATAASGGASALVDLVTASLEQRDLQLWVRNPSLQNLFALQGWDGSVRATDGDYLAVVHANVNGYKTDRVTHDEVSHRARIEPDGSVVDTVTVTRTHYGSPVPRYAALYQKVNADYLRVYVPKGSQLLSATGHTLQEYAPPINYTEAKFATDPDVAEIEGSLRMHYPSGTQVMEEAGKTVFGNWVYVSPGERVSMTYTYRLPWKVKRGGAYSMLVQKQAGAEHTTFTGSVEAEDGVVSGETPRQAALESDRAYVVTFR